MSIEEFGIGSPLANINVILSRHLLFELFFSPGAHRDIKLTFRTREYALRFYNVSLLFWTGVDLLILDNGSILLELLISWNGDVASGIGCLQALTGLYLLLLSNFVVSLDLLHELVNLIP